MSNGSVSRTILVGEGEREVRGCLEMTLKCLGYSVELAQDGYEVLACLQSTRTDFAAVLLDLMMPNLDGIGTLREIRRLNASLPVIMLSGEPSTCHVVATMKSGGTDFLGKPVALEDLRMAIDRAVDADGRESIPRSRNTAPVAKSFFSRHPQMKEIHATVGLVGWSEAPVLIQGETGSGKEVIARELHAQSPRADKPFLKLNCAALPSELVESELFGYERGAFTGAIQRKAGMFERADRGTILLDEIGDMDVRLQAKLLQVLQDQEFQRVGGKETVKVDVRVMAATHRDLDKAIAEGSFRQDLYYRLNVINIVLPPLRERSEDIIPLAEHLMKRHALPGVAIPVIAPELKQAMLSHPWPGNVRELENLVRKLLILGNPGLLARELRAKATRQQLAPSLRSAAMSAPPAEKGMLEQASRAKDQAERQAILATLNATRWNRRHAAVLLRIDYKALLYKMKKLDIDEKRVSDGVLPSPYQQDSAGRFQMAAGSSLA
jgi:two-component system, NtrC family, response regulator AtoC